MGFLTHFCIEQIFDLDFAESKSWQQRLDRLMEWAKKGGVLVMSYDAFKNMVNDDETRRKQSTKTQVRNAAKPAKKKSKREREREKYLPKLQDIMFNSGNLCRIFRHI